MIEDQVEDGIATLSGWPIETLSEVNR